MRVGVLIERTDTIELEIDPDKFIQYYEVEWKEYIEDDEEVTDELKMDFIKESIYEVGPDEFRIIRDDDPELGIVGVLNSDDETSVSVRRL